MSNDLIYVSIPSLPDKEIFFTIQQCLSMAKNPQNIRIGIAYYHDLKSDIDPYGIAEYFNNKNIQIKVYDVSDKNNFGVGKGRNAATQFYNNEKYFLQIDSHTNFKKNWDKKLIKPYKKSLKRYGPNVLTACLPRYKRDEQDVTIIDPYARYPIYDGFKTYNPDVPNIQNVYIKTNKKVEYAIKVSASMIFSEAKNILNNRIPEWVEFWEEEVIQSIEIYNDGLKILFVQNPPMNHLDFSDVVYGINDRKHMSQYFSDNFISKRIEMTNKNFKQYLENNSEKVKKYEKYAKLSFENKTTQPIGFIPYNE